MWSALRSDLKEFVSAVAEDSSSVLHNIDSNLSNNNNNNTKHEIENTDEDSNSIIKSDNDQDDDDDESHEPSNVIIGDDGVVTYIGDSKIPAAEEAERRMDMEETYTEPLLKNEMDFGNRKKHHDGSNENDQIINESSNDIEAEKIIDGSSDKNETDEKICEDESSDGGSNDDDQQDPEYVKSVMEFLERFDIQDRTNDVSNILAEYPDTVGTHFTNLVPISVTYEQFWQRYFYRCDPERIQKEWDDENERIRLYRKEMFEKSVKSVQNLFGGAMNALKSVKTKKEELSLYEKYQSEVNEREKAMMYSNNGNNEKAKENKNKGLFSGRMIRPPFVLNSNVSDEEDEDLDDQDSDHDDEEDEEIGWGSDDDDYIEENNEEESETNRTSESEHEIIFSTSKTNESVTIEMNNLRDKLRQLEEENDKLQNMIETHQKDLSASIVTQQSSTSEGDNKDLEEEIKSLKLTISEKDAEIVALNAKLDDTTTEKYEAVINSLNEELKHKNEATTQLNQDLSELHVQTQSALASKENMIKELEANIDSISCELNNLRESYQQKERDMDGLNTDFMNLKVEMSETSNRHEQMITDLENKLKDLEDLVSVKENELQKVALELENTRSELDCKTNEFSKKLEEEMSKLRSESSHASSSGSESSGVKVTSSSPELLPSNSDSDGDGDDWGDSWGDDL